VSWRDIAKWNQIDPNNTLFVGATLYLYDAKPQAIDRPVPVKAESKPESYTVKANDSLTGVADQFGLTVKQLADYNNLSVTR
jgi:LysM repeat protein